MRPKDSLQIKQRIKQQFSTAAENYDGSASLQKSIAGELLSFTLPHIPSCPLPRNILDIGCGTGFLTYLLKREFSSARLFAFDLAAPMVKAAKSKSHGSDNIFFLSADCETLPYKKRQFDLITSNLTYQWLVNPETTFSEVYRVMKQGGIFSFSTLGGNTLKEIRECYKDARSILNKDGIPPFMTFANFIDITSKLKDSGFKDISFAVHVKHERYDDMLHILKTLKSIGARNPHNMSEKSLGSGAILKKMSEIYREKFGFANKVSATYEVLLFTAKKQPLWTFISKSAT